MNQYVLQPIGYVRNEISSPEAVPYNGAPSVLELLPEHLPAAAGLEPGYVWIVTWLHLSERRAGKAQGSGVRGCFASRTPSRLNPVSLTVARLTQIDACLLTVDALDVCSGTPLLDIKPYVREFDCVFSPADPSWRRSAIPEQRLARHVRTIERFCGPLSPDLALAARLATAVDRDLDLPANSRSIAWDCSCRLPVASGIQAVSGAQIGDPRFRLSRDEGYVSAQTDEQRVRYRLNTPPPDCADVLSTNEASLFERDA